MNISFKNKNVLVTGASQGIGREIAKSFATYGAKKVFAVAKTEPGLNELSAECPNIVPVVVDLADWNCTKDVVGKFEPIDILVNCAGIAIITPFLNITSEEIDSTVAINVKAIINISQVVIKKMIDNKISGTIVNISSQASKMTLADHTVYSLTKAAVDSLTKQIAFEFGQYGIRANTVNPTVVWTEMGKKHWSDEAKSKPILDRIPLHKFAEVSDVVDAVIFLASDKAKMINAHNLPVEGGILST